ncbi:MAG TPA: cation transporter [Bacteroidia bacterium]|nr:cation transporter [Bacteroidia bacterium]
MATKTTHIKVSGMTCGHCEKTVRNAISEVDGVIEAKVDLATASAEVVYDDSRTSETQIKSAVNETGIYKAE